MVNWRRVLLSGFVLPSIVFITGAGIEFWWLGTSNHTAFTRLQADVDSTVSEISEALSKTALELSDRATDSLNRETIQIARTEQSLFNLLDSSRSEFAITIYSANASARAWSGRPSELQENRILGEATLFATPGPLGLRLVRIQPLIDNVFSAESGNSSQRLGSIAVESLLSSTLLSNSSPDNTFILYTPIAPVSLRAIDDNPSDLVKPFTFRLSAPSSKTIIEANVKVDDLERTRTWLRIVLLRVVLVLFLLTIFIVVGPTLDNLYSSKKPEQYIRVLLKLFFLIAIARGLLWFIFRPSINTNASVSEPLPSSETLSPLIHSPIDFLLTGLTLLALSSLIFHALSRWRLINRRYFHPSQNAHELISWFTFYQALSGMVVAAILVAYGEYFLKDILDATRLEIPGSAIGLGDPSRLLLLIGLLFFNTLTVWSVVAILVGGLSFWRIRRLTIPQTTLILTVWIFPGLFLSRMTAAPVIPTLFILASCIIIAFVIPRQYGWYRRASYAPRLLVSSVSLFVPAFLFYPSLTHYSDQAKRELIERDYAVQVSTHPEEIREKLFQSLENIDATLELNSMARRLKSETPEPPRTDRAFLIWRQTPLAELRLTSAVELYGSDRSLVSRFALNVPEYTATTQSWQGSGCTWDVFGVAAPLGAQERQLLHAERGLCEPHSELDLGSGQASNLLGAIVVEAMLDYEAMPFISSETPYFELLRGASQSDKNLVGGEGVELVIYGWGLSPIFSSHVGAWTITDELFERLYLPSRQPFWTRLDKGNETYHVYFVNNRVGIYALGYPFLRPFDHLVQLAEIMTIVGGTFLVMVFGFMLFNRFTRRLIGPRRNLLREIRSSFYRKLFLAFIAAAIVPVLALALVIRTYFANQLRADIETGATRTVAIAKRVIEESAEVQRTPAQPAVPVSDDLMVWISQVIDQDVNIFDGPRLIATSKRDLFASGLLPTRTTDEVYRAIVLERLPSFVGEDSLGNLSYLVAAAPVRAGERDVILTVPLGLRQQEIERQIIDLDRGIQLGALIFIFLGAGIGLYMAERIADPVKRLTRATRQIAEGNFDARLVVRSADELQRLIEAFNRMAAELKVQQSKLERTHRLEAWAEMARQVAHEIKNPLTPVQLSAEHLLRVHADRGSPLTPVVENCVDSILKQVRLLRQIASEFSSFASSPSVHLTKTDLKSFLREVLEPYLADWQDKIKVSVDLCESLPIVLIDRILIARALTNIVENALHAMQTKGSLDVTANYEAKDNAVRLRMVDTGMGLDEESLARVFEPYFSTKATGTGLGMTIAKRNVELSGGRIHIDSEKGTGTTVSILLPIQQRDDH